MSIYSPWEFTVRLFVTNLASFAIPSLEYWCLLPSSPHRQACSIVAGTKSRERYCPILEFEDWDDYQQLSLDGSLGRGCNRIVLQDASYLYNNETEATPGALIRHGDGRNDVAVCPIGSQMTLRVAGRPHASQLYRLAPAPRVQLVDDLLPDGCLMVGNKMECPSMNHPNGVVLRFESMLQDVSHVHTGILVGNCSESCSHSDQSRRSMTRQEDITMDDDNPLYFH